MPKTTKRRAKPKAPKSTGIAHSLQAWATAMGCERRTLESRLVNTGYQRKAKGEKIPFRAIYITLLGDEQAEKVRGMKLDNEERERNAQEESGELVRMHEVEKLLAARVIAPVRQELMNMPSMLANLCNPSDPAKADAVLTGWRDEFFGLMVEKLK